MKKIGLSFIIVLVFSLLLYVSYSYRDPNYIYPGKLFSNIYTSIPINNDDVRILIEVLKNPGIDKKVSNLSGTVEVSFDRIVNLSDGIGYKILFQNTTDTVITYVRTTSRQTWYFEDVGDIHCEGSGCPKGFLGKLLNSIIISSTPLIITDIVIGNTGDLQLLLGEDSSWISTIDRGP